MCKCNNTAIVNQWDFQFHMCLMSTLTSKWLDLILALNHFNKQSAAIFSSQLNISEIAIFFIFRKLYVRNLSIVAFVLW